jgi:hypothetical protein
MYKVHSYKYGDNVPVTVCTLMFNTDRISTYVIRCIQKKVQLPIY